MRQLEDLSIKDKPAQSTYMSLPDRFCLNSKDLSLPDFTRSITKANQCSTLKIKVCNSWKINNSPASWTNIHPWNACQALRERSLTNL